MEFKNAQLSNSLNVIAEVNKSARSVAMGFFIRTGSRDEVAEVAGVSHFLEHMMFKGTANRSALEVNLEFDQMGAKYNAFTSEENTVYYAAVLPEYQLRVLELWADLMRPALRKDDFDTEKGVICEEIAMYKDMPHFDVADRCRKLHFDKNPCGNSVLGTVDSIKALGCEQMLEYFRHRYAPDNMVLACSGNVDWDEFLAKAQELCGGWQPSTPSRKLTNFAGTAKLQPVTDAKIVREHICLMSAAPAAQSELRYAASLLAGVIGDDTGSRMYWGLVDTALADVAEMEYDSMDHTGLFYTYISCDPEKASRVLDITRAMLAKVVTDGVTDAELEAAKNKIASNVTINGELPMGRLVPLGFGWVYNQEYRTVAQEIDAIKSVTHEDIARLLAQYSPASITTLGLGPCEKF